MSAQGINTISVIIPSQSGNRSKVVILDNEKYATVVKLGKEAKPQGHYALFLDCDLHDNTKHDGNGGMLSKEEFDTLIAEEYGDPIGFGLLTKEQKIEAIETTINDLENYEGGEIDEEDAEEAQEQYLNEDGTYDEVAFREYFFELLQSTLSEDEQHYIFDIIEYEQAFENEVVSVEYFDGLIGKLRETLDELLEEAEA